MAVPTPLLLSAMGQITAAGATFTYGIDNAGGYGKLAINDADGLAILNPSGNFLPIVDATKGLGSSAFRWSYATLSITGAVIWDDGAGNQNVFTYQTGVGPVFIDATIGKSLTFDEQSLTGDRTVTWPDADGTVSLSTIGLNAQAGAAYTTVLADAGKIVQCTRATAVAVTIPANASVAYPIGTVIYIEQDGAGQVTVTAAGGVTLHNASSVTTRAQYSLLGVVKMAVNTWLVYGDMT